ncbi:MAG TPA: amidohydrolase family protein [Bacteroidales bacterium]|nr:amidohydrolase family protein [Bacteroidales bacterium]HQJ21483.1 amidohydrolase family protein [Bacteroidales bacterium]
MKYFSAQFVFTNYGPPLKRPIICTTDDFTIVSIEETGGDLIEKNNIEFYNGIIIPGFVNCHCHLELSYLKNELSTGNGLSGFLNELNKKRINIIKDEEKLARKADKEMRNAGIVLCADICNSSLTFDLKKGSKLKYINLIEVFGINHHKAEQRIKEALALAELSKLYGLPYYITPHSVYSLSLPLFRMIKELSRYNALTSVHFLESKEEITFLEKHSGMLMDTYKNFLPPDEDPITVKNHITAILEETTCSGNLILVHNTFIEKKHIEIFKDRANLYYCLCPNSNLLLEDKLPPVMLMADEGCDIVIGTDSLASNNELNILAEIKTLQKNFPALSLETLVRWATLNGARALSATDRFGSIVPGKKPGLILIKDLDLINLKLLPESKAVMLT